MSLEIPFSKPFLTGNELKYIADAAIDISSDGPYTRACSRMLQERFGIKSVFMVPSCTAALEMAAILCNLAGGDEVILPSFTFTSTANAVIRSGAKPVFVDMRPDTLNIDETLIEAHLTSRTKAIIVVHYGGISCDMDRIMSIAQKHKLFVIEDAAQGVNASFRGRALGSIGHLGAYSFHSSKDYTCGEGGALCVNSPELAQRAEIIRDKGTNRGRYLRGEVDKYTWVDTGSSYLPSEIASAFLYAQLEKMDFIKSERRKIFESYCRELAPLEISGIVRLAKVPDDCDTNFHMFYVVLRGRSARDGAIDYLRQKGIGASSHYIPLHSSRMGSGLGYRDGDLPVTEALSARILRLPLYVGMTDAHVIQVATVLREYLAVFGKLRVSETVATGQFRYTASHADHD